MNASTHEMMIAGRSLLAARRVFIRGMSPFQRGLYYIHFSLREGPSWRGSGQHNATPDGTAASTWRNHLFFVLPREWHESCTI